MERKRLVLRWLTRDQMPITLMSLLLLTAAAFSIDILRGYTALRLLPYALAGTAIFSVLMVMRLHNRAAWVGHILVVAVTLLLVFSDAHAAIIQTTSYSILLPTICALLVTSLPMVIGTGVGTYLLLLWQSGGVGVYTDLKNVAFYGLLLTGLVLSHLLREQANTQLAQANISLESEVATRTADLRAALIHIEEIMHARSATVLDVAHDLCNYTQNLRAHATFLEWSYADIQAGVDLAASEDVPALLATLHDSIDRVIVFARGLQDAALLEQQMSLHIEPYGLTDLLRQVMDTFRVVFAQQQIMLIVRPPAQDVEVFVEPTYLRRVFENLLGNALKFTVQHQADAAGGDGQVVVTWDVSAGGTQAVITITDTGIGIAPEALALLGERFTRVHKRSIAGSGVGLNFALRVMKAMGGQLQIASAGLGCGTTVTVTLPLVKPTTLPLHPEMTPLSERIAPEKAPETFCMTAKEQCKQCEIAQATTRRHR